MKLLSRAEILAAEDLTRELVEVPEWGGAVYVRGLTAAEYDAITVSAIEGSGKNHHVNLANLRVKIVAASVVDEDGKRLFSDSDIKALGNKSAAALQRVFSVAQRLSGLGDEALEKATKELKENPFADSSSDSALTSESPAPESS